MYKLTQTQIDNIRNINDFVRETTSLLGNIKNIEIPNIPINTNNETVFIEFRNMKHIEYLIRNMILTLPNWSHTVICGNKNIENIKKYNIHPNLKIINLGKNNLTREEYNKLFLTPKFWNNFIGEKLLMYQADSIIFHNNIDKFLEYDYVGALWKVKYNNYTKVGNGGFSLRSKKIMLECLKKTKEIIYSYNEDMWYTRRMIELKLGKLADEKTAQMFSQEYVKSDNPLGGHQFWLANKGLPRVGLVNTKIKKEEIKKEEIKKEEIKKEEREIKKYIKTNNIDKYVNNVYLNKKRNYKSLIRIINKKDNCIEIDDILYKYLYDIDNKNIYKHIYEKGINSGYIYCEKQLINYFGSGNIYIKQDKLYYKKDNVYTELKKLVNTIYKKTFDELIDDIKIIENKFDNITNDIICCYIGDINIGKILVNKILKSEKKNLSCIFIFKNNDEYLKLKNKVDLFNQKIIFISKEYGNDIIPSLQAINYVLKYYKIENIYKFHTKGNQKWFNDLTDYLLNNKLVINKDCNCIGHPKYYLEIKKIDFCSKLLDKNKDIINKKKFVKGCIFYANVEIFKNVIQFMKKDYFQYFLNNCYDNNAVNYNNSPSHFLERLFGIIKVEDICDEININYKIINENKKENFINNKLYAHLHCYEIDKFDEIYGEYIKNIIKYFSVIVTYSEGEKIPNYNFIILKIQNKGFDIGAKICVNKYLNDNNINYNYILYLHSKSDKIIRRKWLRPFVNSNNIEIIYKLLTLNKNIGLIGTNCRKYNYHNDNDNREYLKYFLSDFNITKESLDNINITDGNMYILNSKVSKPLFNYLNKFSNILYTPNTIQDSWIKIIKERKDILDKFNIPYDSVEKIKKYILEELISKKISGKDIYPDGMIEHGIERFILFFTKNIYKLDYLIIGENIIKDFNIKFDAIYFPQFHEIPENNKFWGEGFTEWTFLKPFSNNINGKKFDMQIYKPHNDIGYYNLDLNHLKKQIKMASDYGINSFMIYHYWFEKCHKVMNKPLEYFLLDEINFNFYLCWANEPWSRKWDGGQDITSEIMLDQKYNNFNEMIEYLIPFFKKPNYQRNEKGEVIYLIYNIEHMTINIFNKLKQIWDNRIKKEGIIISYVFYDNLPKNEKIIKKEKLKRFIFEPMNSNYTIIKPKLTKEEFNKHVYDYYYNSEIKNYLPYDFEILWNHYNNYGYNEGRIKYNGWYCMNVNYLDIIEKYRNIKTEDIEDNIIGLPLNWNNIIRRKDQKFLYVTNFSINNLKELILTIISKIITKYININNHKNYDNRILINAWNEWNEQAILEPNNITGYSNIETIKKFAKYTF